MFYQLNFPLQVNDVGKCEPNLLSFCYNSESYFMNKIQRNAKQLALGELYLNKYRCKDASWLPTVLSA